jgi:hypothetical protein
MIRSMLPSSPPGESTWTTTAALPCSAATRSASSMKAALT